MDTSGTGAIAPRGGRRNEGIVHTSNEVSAPVGDFTKPTGHRWGRPFDTTANHCSCHGDLHDPPVLITEQDAAQFADYGYLLDDAGLTVLLPGGGRMDPGAEVAWSARPDWDDVQRQLISPRPQISWPLRFS